MNKEKDPGFMGIFLLLVLPYLITVIFVGRSECPVSRNSNLEDYLPAVTAAQIELDAPAEAIKAQTVIARSNLYLKWKKGTASLDIQEASRLLKTNKMDDFFLEKFQVFQDAAESTKNEVLSLNGEVMEIPYHQLSQGRTRSAQELMGESYSYIPSVDTSVDIDSPSYVKGCYFTFEELEKKIKKSYNGFSMSDSKEISVLASDAQGYVLQIKIGSQEFQGEQIKELLGLPSSCFSVQILDQQIRFLCKGVGHGMGLSQYTAINMASNKKNYKEILAYFFPELKIEKK